MALPPPPSPSLSASNETVAGYAKDDIIFFSEVWREMRPDVAL